ncbi:hypothetical protein CBM2589_U10005 [Cupriavidus taiwanensis]|uniref:Uncharacterized protein n=1 Tax=Cupriavidus taiwanensis TaxID=164546 RepID=A0A375CQQ3_9BURK|nr:hypothetical protein CBM2589_U10005 [Cupriavidus taiwanensis]
MACGLGNGVVRRMLYWVWEAASPTARERLPSPLEENAPNIGGIAAARNLTKEMLGKFL